MFSETERANGYRRTAERLRRLSTLAKSDEAQEEFSRCARMYDRLADAAPAPSDGASASSPQPRQGEAGASWSVSSD